MTDFEQVSEQPPMNNLLSPSMRSDSLVTGDVDEIEELEANDSEEAESPEKKMALQDSSKSRSLQHFKNGSECGDVFRCTPMSRSSSTR